MRTVDAVEHRLVQDIAEFLKPFEEVDDNDWYVACQLYAECIVGRGLVVVEQGSTPVYTLREDWSNAWLALKIALVSTVVAGLGWLCDTLGMRRG